MSNEIVQQDVEMVRGSTHTFAIAVTDADDEPYTLKSGETLIFGVKKDPRDQDNLIQKTVTAGENGVYNVEFVPGDTADLAFGKYFYDAAVQSDANFFPVIPISVFHIKKNVTKWGDVE